MFKWVWFGYFQVHKIETQGPLHYSKQICRFLKNVRQMWYWICETNFLGKMALVYLHGKDSIKMVYAPFMKLWMEKNKMSPAVLQMTYFLRRYFQDCMKRTPPPIRRAIVKIIWNKKNKRKEKCRRGCGERRSFAHCWWECKMESNDVIPQKIKNRITSWCSNSTFGYIPTKTESKFSKRFLHTHAYSSVIYNRQKVEAIQVSIERRMNKQSEVST